MVLGSIQTADAVEVGLGSRTSTGATQPRKVLSPSCSSQRARRPLITSWGSALIEGYGRPGEEKAFGSVQAGGGVKVGDFGENWRLGLNRFF